MNYGDVSGLVEQLAAAAHDSWMESNKANGVTTALSRLTGEEQMAPYDQLSEQVKEYDRVMVRGVLSDIKRLGYKVVAA